MKIEAKLRARPARLAAILVLALAPKLSFAQEYNSAPEQVQTNSHAGHQMPGMEQKTESTQPPPHDHSQMSGHQGMNMPGMNHGTDMNEAGMFLMKMASGTSMNP